MPAGPVYHSCFFEGPLYYSSTNARKQKIKTDLFCEKTSALKIFGKIYRTNFFHKLSSAFRTLVA